jgi:hypothetical protein
MSNEGSSDNKSEHEDLNSIEWFLYNLMIEKEVHQKNK